MKFAATAVILALALALGVQASVIPLAHHEIAAHAHGLSYTAVSGPAHIPVWGHPAGSVAVHAAVAPAWHAHAAVAPAWHAHAAGPVVVAGHPWAHAHSAVLAHGHPAHAVVVGPAHEGTYVAQTRGAVHTAPLAGHLQSAAAINVAPAPGTV